MEGEEEEERGGGREGKKEKARLYLWDSLESRLRWKLACRSLVTRRSNTYEGRIRSHWAEGEVQLPFSLGQPHRELGRWRWPCRVALNWIKRTRSLYPYIDQ